MSRKRTLSYYKRYYPEHFHLFYNLENQKLDQELRHNVINKFWSFMPENTENLKNLYEPLMDAVQFLYSNRTKSKLSDIQSLILSSVPHHSNIYILKTYSQAFKAFLNLIEPSNSGYIGAMSFVDTSCVGDNPPDEVERHMDGNVSNTCPGCDRNLENDECVCQSIYDRFLTMNEQLRFLGLLSQLVGDAVISVLRIFTEKKIRGKCASDFRSSFINELRTWVGDTVTTWVRQVYGLNSTNGAQKQNVNEMESIGMIESRLNYFLCHTYADIRVEQLFEIIIDYPASEAAVQDLKDYLDNSASPKFKKNLVHSLRSSLTKRLLDPGVNTMDILTTYISAIKALNALDPCGLILHLSTQPVRRYLKSRDDTVHCIIKALTDKDHSELNKEMIKSTEIAGADGDLGVGGIDGCGVDTWQNWRPDPIDIGYIAAAETASSDMTHGSSAAQAMTLRRSEDIISTLVNIYESKDLFVEEYQKQLGNRLLQAAQHYNDDSSAADDDLNTEFKNLELLTIKFNDCELHRCEVMLRDIKTSKRMNKRIMEDDVQGCEMHGFRNFKTIIVSSPFWPEKLGLQGELNDDAPNVKFPEEIEKAIATYTAAYETIQGSRTLCWKHHLGLVNLELEINGKEYEFNVPPLSASIIYHFEERESWRLSELAQDMNFPVSLLRQKLQFWVDRGILCTQAPDIYSLISDPSSSKRLNSLDDTEVGSRVNNDLSNTDMSYEMGQQSGPSRDAADIDDDGFAILWTFIRNMLINVNSMALSRMHALVKHFAVKDEITTQELQQKLQAKIDQGLLTYQNGVYKLMETRP